MAELFESSELPARAKPRPLPPLMLRDEILTVSQAAYIVRKSTRIIRNWNDEHGIGQQNAPNAPIEISWIALLMVAGGDFETLEKFRRGDRRSWEVVRYFQTFGFSGADVISKRDRIEKQARQSESVAANAMMIDHESDPKVETLPQTSSRVPAEPMRSLQSPDWRNEMDEASFDDHIVQIALNGGRVLDTFRSALFSAAGREGISINEFVLRSAGERLQRSGYRFNGVFDIDDVQGGN